MTAPYFKHPEGLDVEGPPDRWDPDRVALNRIAAGIRAKREELDEMRERSRIAADKARFAKIHRSALAHINNKAYEVLDGSRQRFPWSPDPETRPNMPQRPKPVSKPFYLRDN